MQKEVFNILAFFDIFKKALFKEEIEDFLGDKKINNQYLKNNFSQQGYLWTLKRREENFANTIKTLRKSKKYLIKAKKYSSFLRFMPFVRGISVCNTVSFFAAEKKSDIDLFIIAEKNHIWTARFFVTIMLQILGVRRHGNKIAGKLCLSFFADTENLDLSKIKLDFDPFLAFWASTQVPLFGAKAFERFAKENENWIKDEIGINIRFKKDLHSISEPFSVFLEKIFGNWFEKIIKKILLKRTKKKMKKLDDKSGTIISNGILKFHNIDRREEFAKEFKKRILNI